MRRKNGAEYPPHLQHFESSVKFEKNSRNAEVPRGEILAGTVIFLLFSSTLVHIAKKMRFHVLAFEEKGRFVFSPSFSPFLYLPISSGKGGKAILLMTFPFRASSSCESPKWAVRRISSVAKLKTRNHRAHNSFSQIFNFHFVSFHKRLCEKILVNYNIINKDGRSILANEQSQANFLSQAVVELLKRNKNLI